VGVSIKSGTFATGTGAVSSTISESGFGFQPKAVLFMWNGRTEATDTVGRQDIMFGMGASDGTNDYSFCAFDSDNVTTTNGGMRLDNNECIVTADGDGLVTGSMSMQSLDAGGFTLVVTVQMPASYRVQYIAFGGDEITNAAVGFKTLLASTTGNTSVTGLGFQPNFGIFCGLPQSGNGSVNSRTAGGFGAVISTTERFTSVGGSDDGVTTSDTGAYIYASGECVAIPSVNTPASVVDGRANFVSWDSGGFTIDTVEMIAFNRDFLYLVLKGGSWSIDAVTTQTNTTSDITITGLPYTPRGGIICSTHRAESASDTASPVWSYSIGFFDSATNRSCMAILDRDALTTTDTKSAVDFDSVYVNIDDASAIQGEMDLISIDSGGLTMRMRDADPSGVLAMVITAGDATSSVSIFNSPDNIDSYSQGVRVVPGN